MLAVAAVSLALAWKLGRDLLLFLAVMCYPSAMELASSPPASSGSDLLGSPTPLHLAALFLPPVLFACGRCRGRRCPPVPSPAILSAVCARVPRAGLARRLAGRAGQRPDGGAAALDEDHVTPAAMMLADPFADPHGAESGGPVQRGAGGVLREDAALDGPDPGRLGGADQGVQELAADALAAGARVHVDRVLDHPGVHAAAGHSQEPATQPRTSPPDRATSRWPGSLAAENSSHVGVRVSNVALPSSIPA